VKDKTRIPWFPPSEPDNERVIDMKLENDGSASITALQDCTVYVGYRRISKETFERLSKRYTNGIKYMNGIIREG
jgi:hypothetical protein